MTMEGIMEGTDMKVADTPTEGLKDYSTDDAYKAWLKEEGVKVYEDFYFPSIAKIELGPWERKGGSGAVIHIKTPPCTTTVTSSRSSPGASPSRSIICTS